MAVTTALELSEDELLEALRLLDQFRHWGSLDEERYCLVCGKLITGRQVRIASGTRGSGPMRLTCPTKGCNSIPMDWVLPTNEILVNLEALAAQEEKASSMEAHAVTDGIRNAVRIDNRHEHLVSRLRRLASHLIWMRFSGATRKNG